MPYQSKTVVSKKIYDIFSVVFSSFVSSRKLLQLFVYLPPSPQPPPPQPVEESGRVRVLLHTENKKNSN